MGVSIGDPMAEGASLDVGDVNMVVTEAVDGRNSDGDEVSSVVKPSARLSPWGARASVLDPMEGSLAAVVIFTATGGASRTMMGTRD